jgi:hypothetical protein
MPTVVLSSNTLVAYINQPKEHLASIADRMIISMDTPVSQMAR